MYSLIMLFNILISDLIPPSEVDGSSTYESVVGKGTLICCRFHSLPNQVRDGKWPFNKICILQNLLAILSRFLLQG